MMIVLQTFYVTLAFYHIKVSAFSSDGLSSEYPGLTRAEARCPESAGDGDYWHVFEIYNKTPVCYGRRDLPANLHTFKDVEAACREKHESAFPARLYTDQHFGVLLDLGMAYSAIIGAYFKNNPIRNETEAYGINSTDEFVVYLHGNAITATNLTEWSANPKNKYILCMTPAYPRVMDSNYNKNKFTQPNLTEYMCEGDGWDLQAFCGGTFFCYKKLEKFQAPSAMLEFYTEFNACGMEEPNSFLASVHCQDEYGYLRFKHSGHYQLGLYLPHRGPWNKFDSWQWVDQTPADWIPWYQRQPDNCRNYNEKTVHISDYGDANDVNLKRSFSSNEMPAICKKPAVKKELPLDVKKYATFEKNSKKCRLEPVAHWNRRCPTNSSLWQIVQSEAGVHCYAFIDAPVPLSSDNFTHELCYGLHPEAKLASFHYDRQFGVLYPLTHHANNIIVGLVPNNQTFVWADGTPMNKSFWAPSEPLLNTSNIVVRIEKAKLETPWVRGCGNEKAERPLFKTEKMEDIKNGMKVACKIEAEPVLPCAPVPDANGMESLNNTVCKDGWIKQRFCDKVYCYKVKNVAREFQDFVHAVEHDYCHTYHSESYLASVHCIEEHFFVQNFSPRTLIGLHIPTKLQNEMFDVKNFEWTDGTPVDFVGWNRFSNAETVFNKQYMYAPLFPATVNETGKYAQVYNKVDDSKSGWSNSFGGFQQVLCKMKATVKTGV